MLCVDGEETGRQRQILCSQQGKQQGVPGFPSLGVRNFRTESEASK